MASALNETSRRLFAPIASDYERWARLLSLGQDGRWRRRMVDGLGLEDPADVLDVATGTGSITRLLQSRGHEVTPVDLSFDMLSHHTARNRVLARAELLPFADASFDAVTTGYLLRYVDDPVACLSELSRVVRSGGVIGMVEFGLPSRIVRPAWRLYSGVVLPGFGRLISPGWRDVARFLRPSIENFHRNNPDPLALWEKAGLVGVRVRRLSFGSGLVVWARKP